MWLYLLRNTVTGLEYVGTTTRSLSLRLSDHRYRAKAGQRQGPLYDAIRAHGFAAFQAEVLAAAATYEELLEKEQRAIKERNTQHPHGYNLVAGGRGNFGWQMKDETRQKIAAKATGRRGSMLGRTLTPEQKMRVKDAAQRREQRRREAGIVRAAWNRGLKMPPEVGRKIGDKHRGRPLSADHKAALSFAMRDHATPERRARWSAARARWWAARTPEQRQRHCEAISAGHRAVDTTLSQ